MATLSHLYIDPQVAHTPLAQSIRTRLKHVPSTIADDAKRIFDRVQNASDPVQAGKEILYLTRNRGAFIKDCPGTRTYICCGYKILHIGSFCNMDCAYCILQAYFHPPLLTLFCNLEDLAAELDGVFATPGVQRIGTGEFTDSMIWENWTDLSRHLVPAFSEQSRAVLELKTKTTAISALGTLTHNRKTIMAWSLNTPRIITGEERGTASLEARLRAAKQCESWGYPLAFHFDPMVLYDGCEAEYRAVVDQLFRTLNPDNVVWISLGTFRYMPPLKRIIAHRFPRSTIVYGEFIPGLDGKMRYFKPLRLDLYRKMVRWIGCAAPDVRVYFCMEDEAIWDACMGYHPEEPGGLARMLDDRAAAVCGLHP